MSKTQERLINHLQIQLTRAQQEIARLQAENERLRSIAYQTELKMSGGGAAVDDIARRADEDRRQLEGHIKKLQAMVDEYAVFVPLEIAQPAIDDAEGQKIIAEMERSTSSKVMMTTHDKATPICITIAVRTDAGSQNLQANFSISKIIAVYPGSVKDVHQELPGWIESLIARAPVEPELRYRAIPGLEDERGRAIVLTAIRDVASYWHLEDFRSSYFQRIKGAYDHYIAPRVDYTRIEPRDAYDRWRKTVKDSLETMTKAGRGVTEKPTQRLRRNSS